MLYKIKFIIIIITRHEEMTLHTVVQVGNLNLTTLTQLASEPKHNNTFNIENYTELKGLLDNLQKKIYNIEGKMQMEGKLKFSDRSS